MVLCPFVFLLTDHNHPPLRLQPTEVGSTHWVPIRVLLSPSLRTFEYCDVSDRLARRWGSVVRTFLRVSLGRMAFAAVRLVPTESLYSSTGSENFPVLFQPPDERQHSSYLDNVTTWWQGHPRPPPNTAPRPILLWGLTLGIIADFLDLLPAHDALRFWTYPTFTAPDLRLILWIMAYRFRRRKVREMKRGEENAYGTAAVEEGLDAVSAGQWTKNEVARPAEVGIGGLGVGSSLDRSQHQHRSRLSRSSAVGNLLEGYFDIIQRAVVVAVVMRVAVGSGLLLSLMIWHRRRTRQ